MSPAAEDLLKQALTLDEKDRASVAGALIESLHDQVDPDAEEAWDVEIRRRVEELESGNAETIPWAEVRERLSVASSEVIRTLLKVRQDLIRPRNQVQLLFGILDFSS